MNMENIPKNKTIQQLKHTFQQKIEYLREQITAAISKPIMSDIREEYANNIAVVLRALVTYSTSCESLAKRCDYDKTLYFPLYSPMAAQNLLRQYKLVGLTWNPSNKMGTFNVIDDLDDPEKVRCVQMTFESWKNESVIDFHSNDFPPLSREKVIRIVADKLGAHVDSKIEEHLYKTESDHILPVFFEQNGTIYYGNGRNLFTETIIGIAKELVFAYTYTNWTTLHSAGEPAYYLFTQDYNNTKKYTVCKTKINAYNANPFFPCTISESKLKRYNILFRQRIFDIGIIGK